MLAVFLTMPEIVSRKLINFCLLFWNRQSEAVKRLTFYNSFSDGGFHVINIRVKIDSFRVKHMLNIIKGRPTNAKCGVFAKYWVGIHLRKYAPTLAALECPHSERMPPFYWNVLHLFRMLLKYVETYLKNVSKNISYHTIRPHYIVPNQLFVQPFSKSIIL